MLPDKNVFFKTVKTNWAELIPMLDRRKTCKSKFEKFMVCKSNKSILWSCHWFKSQQWISNSKDNLNEHPCPCSCPKQEEGEALSKDSRSSHPNWYVLGAGFTKTKIWEDSCMKLIMLRLPNQQHSHSTLSQSASWSGQKFMFSERGCLNKVHWCHITFPWPSSVRTTNHMA